MSITFSEENALQARHPASIRTHLGRDVLALDYLSLLRAVMGPDALLPRPVPSLPKGRQQQRQRAQSLRERARGRHYASPQRVRVDAVVVPGGGLPAPTSAHRVLDVNNAIVYNTAPVTQEQLLRSEYAHEVLSTGSFAPRHREQPFPNTSTALTPRKPMNQRPWRASHGGSTTLAQPPVLFRGLKAAKAKKPKRQPGQWVQGWRKVNTHKELPFGADNPY